MSIDNVMLLLFYSYARFEVIFLRVYNDSNHYTLKTCF